MEDLAALLRAMQLYAHAAHNLTKGKTFFEDHETFGEFYGAYTAAYDEVVERIIGLTGSCDINAITEAASKVASTKKFTSAEDAYSVLLASEKRLCKLAEKENESASLGTQDLLQGLANASEKRMFVINQRLA